MMARIRQIKPDFFRSEDVANLEPIARLLFVGLWTLADREGRLLDRPRRIAIELFPYDRMDDKIDLLLGSLAARGFIDRSDGRIRILRWFHWQGSAYLDSTWRTIRKSIIARDGSACASCSSTKRLDVHHKAPVRTFDGDLEAANSPENLITLCRRCHAKADADVRQAERGRLAQ